MDTLATENAPIWLAGKIGLQKKLIIAIISNTKQQQQ